MTDLSQFSQSQLERFQRHFSLTGFGPEAQARLLDSRVLVIGAGGLGSPILTYLAAAGVGSIDVVDHDVVDRSNLHRQVIHSEESIGRPKTESAAETMRGLHPEAQIREIREPITPDNALRLVEPVDIVVDGSDNFATRYVVSDACEISGKPLVSGSILRFDGQVSLFWSAPTAEHWPDGGRGPTYRDLYPEAPDAGEVPTCAEAGVLGVLPGVIGTLMAAETIKFLAGVGKPLLGRVLSYDALAASFREITLKPDPEREPVTRIGADVSGLGLGSAAGAGFGSAAGLGGFDVEGSSAASTCGTPVGELAGEAAQEEGRQAAEQPDIPVVPGEIDPYVGIPYTPEDISPGELARRLEEGRAVVVDVREPWEYAMSHVEGAVNIPLGDLWGPDVEVPGAQEATEERPLVLYCKIGARSRQGLEALRARHPELPLRNLVGGFSAFQNLRQGRR